MVTDCADVVSDPDRLVFTICWQHSKEDKWDNLDKYKKTFIESLSIDKSAFSEDLKYNESENSSDKDKNLSEELEKLNNLLKEGVLTQDEFEKAKKKLLDI